MATEILIKPKCIAWQWRNFFILLYRSFTAMMSGKLSEMFVTLTSLSYSKINQMIQFYSNNATNLQHLTSHITPCCPHNIEIALWPQMTVTLLRHIYMYTVCQKHPPFYFSNICVKIHRFNDFWCVKSWENLTSVACTFAHLTCIL